MPKKADEKHKEICCNIAKDWKLTGLNRRLDFVITSMMAYFQCHPYAEISQQSIIDVSEIVIYRLFTGIKTLIDVEDEVFEFIFDEYVKGDVHKAATLKEIPYEAQLKRWLNKRKQLNNPKTPEDTTKEGMYV